MIRFTCASCGRAYDLPDALARLALLCKGCGQRLVVPEPTAEPPPDHPFHVAAGTVDLFPEADVPRKKTDARDEFTPEDSVELFPKAALEPPPVGASPASRGRALAVVVDVVVGLALAGLGALLGQFATGRGTMEVLRDAGGAPSFPPVDLLLWLGCVVTPVLGYVVFANRGNSAGAWLRRQMMEG